MNQQMNISAFQIKKITEGCSFQRAVLLMSLFSQVQQQGAALGMGQQGLKPCRQPVLMWDCGRGQLPCIKLEEKPNQTKTHQQPTRPKSDVSDSSRCARGIWKRQKLSGFRQHSRM